MTVRSKVPDALWVVGPEGLVGTLYPTEPLSFTYSDDWLGKPTATPIHPDIPLSTGPIDSPTITAFFENLLPSVMIACASRIVRCAGSGRPIFAS